MTDAQKYIALLEQKGMSLSAISRAIGRRRATISEIKNGKHSGDRTVFQLRQLLALSSPQAIVSPALPVHVPSVPRKPDKPPVMPKQRATPGRVYYKKSRIVEGTISYPRQSQRPRAPQVSSLGLLFKAFFVPSRQPERITPVRQLPAPHPLGSSALGAQYTQTNARYTSTFVNAPTEPATINYAASGIYAASNRYRRNI